MSIKVDIEYCGEVCEVGKAKSKVLLADNNSACDAAIDFRFFIEDCQKTCTRNCNLNS
jgi:hypothetical protein